MGDPNFFPWSGSMNPGGNMMTDTKRPITPMGTVRGFFKIA
jgi:hypothetical protein